jgi:Mrp family chromosome partitioning ATPase
VLIGDASLTDAVRTVHVPQVWKSGGVLGVLASRRTFADPAILVAGSTMAELVETVRTRFDVVLIEASPLLGAGDAPILAALSDGLLVVASLDRLERDQAGRAAYLLDDLGIEPVGVVVTGYGGEIVEPPATPPAPPKPAPVHRQSATQPQRV